MDVRTVFVTFYKNRNIFLSELKDVIFYGTLCKAISLAYLFNELKIAFEFKSYQKLQAFLFPLPIIFRYTLDLDTV